MAEDALVGAGGLPLSADILRPLLESSQDVLYAVALNPVRMLYATPGFARRMGLPEDFLSHGYEFSKYLPSVHPDDQARVAALMAAIAASRSDAELPENPAIYRLRTPEGGWRVISDSYRILRNADGAAHTLIGNARDISERSSAQQTLKEREARFRLLAENSRDVFFSMRFPEGRYEYLSPSVEALFGHAPQEFYKDPATLMRCIAPAWRETVQGWLADIARGDVAETYEFQVQDKNGRLRWMNQRQVLVAAPDGKNMLLQGVATDVTELREARQALADNEARFRSLAENSRDIFFSFRLWDGRYEYVSSRVTDIYGHPPQAFYEDPGLFLRCLAPEWRDQMLAWMAEIEQGNLRDKYEFEVVDGQGRRRWIEERLVLVPAPNGQGMLLQGVATDQTEDHAAKEALRQSEERYRELVEGTQSFITQVDGCGRFTYVNPIARTVLGMEPEDCVGRLAFEIVHPDDREPTIAAFQSWLAQKLTHTTFENRLISTAGEVRHFSWSIRLHYDDAGNTTVIDSIARDITDQKRAEAALRKSNARNRLIVETATEGIWTVDADERATFVNDAMARMMGYTAQEMLGLKTESFLFPEDMEGHRHRMAQRRTGQDEIYERRFLRKDGTTLWTLASAKPLWDEAGRYDGAFAMFVDISERKQAEESLRETNARYAILAENVVDVIWTTDENLRWTYLSPSAERLSGIPLERLMTMRFDQLFTPESMAMIGELMARRRQSSYEAGQDEAYRAEMDIRNASGALVPLEVLVRPMRKPDGTIYGYCGTSRDISVRKRTEAALRLSQERYALALKGANDGIWDWDLAEDKVYYSDRWKEIIGYAPDEMEHDLRAWTERIHPEDFDRVMQANQKCIRGEAPVFQVEYRLRHKDGSFRWIFGRGAALADASGRVVRMAGAHTDITARKQAEEALYKSERLSRKLLESMHEGIWAVDADRRTTFVNERLCAMLGYASAELMNMSPTDVLEWPQRHVAESQLPDAEAGYSGATDYVLIRKDGTRFPAHVLSSPVMEEQGRFEGLVCGVVDLTERARMEHELRRNQARFEALYELSRLTPATEFQLASFTLREAIRLTESEAGVLFFVSEDGRSLVPKAWETGDLTISGQVPSFPASGPLPWAMVLESGLPLLINDFSECAQHIPPGHPPVTRFLGVPALDGARPVVVLGLIGKVEPYTADDTLQTTLLLDGMWREVRTRRDEHRIRASLSEKEALLHEVHHRVKNNLQVISSLMDMAGRRLSNEDARLSLTELRNKVHAMSLIHAQLHGGRTSGGINMERFVRALFNQLREVYSGGLTLTLVVELSDLALGVDQAVPLGLALNEALTNVFKHASSDGRAGKVYIRAGQDARGRVCVLVRDDGPGLPEGLDPERAQSLGMKLMHGLVRHQLGGSLEIQNIPPPEAHGVEVCICFTSKIAK